MRTFINRKTCAGIFGKMLSLLLVLTMIVCLAQPVQAEETEVIDAPAEAVTSEVIDETAVVETSEAIDETAESDITEEIELMSEADTSEGTDASGETEENEQEITYIAAPANFKAVNTIKGVQLSWTAVTYAGSVGYKVLRTSDTTEREWTELDFYGTASGCSVLDDDVASGETYVYAVYAYDKTTGQRISEISTMDYITYLAPVLSEGITLNNTSSGISIQWPKIAGAVGYYIYKKTGTGSYKYLTTVIGNSTLTYTDKSVKTGVKYTYAVRAFHVTAIRGGTCIKNCLGSFSGKTIIYVAAETPTFSNTSSGILVKWTKVSNASGYYVYRKTLNGSYSRIKTITSGSTLSYTDTAIASNNGTAYIYAVRAYQKVGSTVYTGDFVAKGVFRLTTVTWGSVKNTKPKTMTVAWNKNSAAAGYQIQYADNSTFTNAKLITISSGSTVSRTISGLTKGKTYYVRVRVYKKTSAGTVYYGGFSSTKSVKITR